MAGYDLRPRPQVASSERDFWIVARFRSCRSLLTGPSRKVRQNSLRRGMGCGGTSVVSLWLIVMGLRAVVPVESGRLSQSRNASFEFPVPFDPMAFPPCPMLRCGPRSIWTFLPARHGVFPNTARSSPDHVANARRRQWRFWAPRGAMPSGKTARCPTPQATLIG